MLIRHPLEDFAITRSETFFSVPGGTDSRNSLSVIASLAIALLVEVPTNKFVGVLKVGPYGVPVDIATTAAVIKSGIHRHSFAAC